MLQPASPFPLLPFHQQHADHFVLRGATLKIIESYLAHNSEHVIVRFELGTGRTYAAYVDFQEGQQPSVEITNEATTGNATMPPNMVAKIIQEANDYRISK